MVSCEIRIRVEKHESNGRGKCYNVFVSYRREGGQESAVLFYERLTQFGCRNV